MPSKSRFSIAFFALFLAASALHAAPAAPSDLRMTELGWQSFKFAWRDNASDETGQYIYINEGGAGFYRLARFDANRTNASLLHLVPDRYYEIYLTAVNASGESLPSNTLRVFIPPPELSPRFTWSPSAPTTIDLIQFTDATTGGAVAWLWDFGDGSGSSLQNPSKRYALPGAYVVKLKVQRGTTFSLKETTMTVAAAVGGSPPVVAAFDCASCTSLIGEALQFRDSSTGSPDRWSWSFGDGATSSLQHPLHTFSTAGAHVVSLTAQKGAQTSITTRVMTVMRVDRFIIPVAARTSGAAGSEWRTSLDLVNDSTIETSVDLTFISASAPEKRSLRLAGGNHRHFEDALKELFAIDAAAGAIVITTRQSLDVPTLKISSRTFTGDDVNGTYGQQIAALPTAGRSASRYLTGLRVNDDYRTNVGLVNYGQHEATVELTLFDRIGSRSMTLLLPANSFRQQSLQSLFSSPFETSDMTMSITPSVNSDVVAYGSVVDNLTNDPTYMAATSASPSAELIVSVVGRTAGVASTFWRSDVALHNASREPLDVTFALMGGAASPRAFTLGGSASVTLVDVISWLGADDGVAPLTIRSSRGDALVASTRTYTARTSGGTLGQSIPALTAEDRRKSSTLTGLRHDPAFRTNLGFLSTDTSPVPVELVLRNPDGSVAARARTTLLPNVLLQQPVTTFFDVTPFRDGRFNVSVESATPFFFFGSVIDNLSGDPLFIVAD